MIEIYLIGLLIMSAFVGGYLLGTHHERVTRKELDHHRNARNGA